MALRTLKSHWRKGRKLRQAKWIYSYKVRPKLTVPPEDQVSKPLCGKVVSWQGVLQQPPKVLVRRAASARLSRCASLRVEPQDTATTEDDIKQLARQMDLIAKCSALALCVMIGLLLNLLLDDFIPRPVLTVFMIILGSLVQAASAVIRHVCLELDPTRFLLKSLGKQLSLYKAKNKADVLEEETPSRFVARGTTCINFFEDLNIEFSSRCFRRLSAEQKQVFLGFVFELKNALSNDLDLRLDIPFTYPDDFTLLRFLIADKYQIDQAVARLLSAVKFCQHMRVDKFNDRPPESYNRFSNLRVRRFLGHDKSGRLVIAERMGDFLANLANCDEDAFSVRELLLCHVYDAFLTIQRLRERFVATGRLAWKVVFLADMKGISLLDGLKAIKTLRVVAKQLEVFFPEVAGKIFLLNSSSDVVKLWTMFSKRLDPVFLRKVRISQTVPTKELLAIMDDTVLLREWGGVNDTSFPKSSKGKL